MEGATGKGETAVVISHAQSFGNAPGHHFGRYLLQISTKIQTPHGLVMWRSIHILPATSQLLHGRISSKFTTSSFVVFRPLSMESAMKPPQPTPRSGWKSPVEIEKLLDRSELYAQIRNKAELDLSKISEELPLYQLTNRTLYRVLFVFCIGQFIFWCMCANLLYTFYTGADARGRAYRAILDEQKSSGEEEEEKSLDRRMLDSIRSFATTHRTIIQGSFVVIGNVVAGTILFMLCKCVSFIRLMPGGRLVKVGRLTPFGGISEQRFVLHPLEDLSSSQHRLQRVNFITVKARGLRWSYFIDTDGRFENVDIYDLTVGMSRKL